MEQKTMEQTENAGDIDIKIKERGNSDLSINFQISKKLTMTIERKCLKAIEEIITFCSSGLRRPNYFVPFNVSDSYEIIKKAKEILNQERSVLQIDLNSTENSSINVVGDIHGNIDILVRIFSSEGYPSTTKYIFLGDYIDRGSNSCEVLILLYSYKILFPNNVFLLRGNHEFKDMAANYGFKKECIERIPLYKTDDSYSLDGYDFFNEITSTFPFLPVCAIVNQSIFCVHGGITALLENREQLMGIEKVGVDFTNENSVQVEFMWNDPNKAIEYSYERSPRGIGCLFNNEALESFLKTMKFSMVIRGHQMCNDGFDHPFGKDGGILTVFSSNDYCGEFNSAAIAMISDKNVVSTKEFASLHIQMNRVITPPEVFCNQTGVILDELKINEFKFDEFNIPIST